MSRTTSEIAEEYFRAWKAGDQLAFRALLADDVDFSGPMAHLNNADECATSIIRLQTILTDIVPLKRWIDGDNSVSWFELRTSWTEPIPVANWTHVENGLITEIKVVFDPRAFLAGMPQQ